MDVRFLRRVEAAIADIAALRAELAELATTVAALDARQQRIDTQYQALISAISPPPTSSRRRDANRP